MDKQTEGKRKKGNSIISRIFFVLLIALNQTLRTMSGHFTSVRNIFFNIKSDFIDIVKLGELNLFSFNGSIFILNNYF